MAREYNTKVEGHRGEARRLEMMAAQLELPAKDRKEIAAQLRAKAAIHWEKAGDITFASYAANVAASAESDDSESVELDNAEA